MKQMFHANEHIFLTFTRWVQAVLIFNQYSTTCDIHFMVDKYLAPTRVRGRLNGVRWIYDFTSNISIKLIFTHYYF